MQQRSQLTGGYVLITALTLSLMLVLMVAISANLAVTTARTTATEARKQQAFYVAQSGMERAIARIAELSSMQLPPYITSNEQAAQWLVTQLNGMTSTLPGAGRFVLSAQSAPGALSTADATLTLYSQGTSVNDGSSRRIVMTFPVRLETLTKNVNPMTANAPAALTVTGNSGINGSAPIAGETNPLGTIHTMQCPALLRLGATCRKSAIGPDKYTLSYKASTIPTDFTVGKIVRPTTVAAGQTSEERYIVTGVNSTTKEVEMTVLSDYIAQSNGTWVNRTFSATDEIKLQERNDVPALLVPPNTSFSNISANVRDVCTTYACEHYTMSPNDLFRMMMGGSKDEMREVFQQVNQSVPGTYNTTGSAGCIPNVQWLALSGPSANLNECQRGQLVVIDARGQRSLDINIPTQDSFRGLLYVLADPGVSVKMTGNVGFAGGVVMDNGSGGIDMTGTGNFNTDCQDEQAEDGLKKTPKLCYDAAILGQVRQEYIDTILTSRKAIATVTSQNWAEVGGQP